MTVAAHRYQQQLVSEMMTVNVPMTKRSRRGIFHTRYMLKVHHRTLGGGFLMPGSMHRGLGPKLKGGAQSVTVNYKMILIKRRIEFIPPIHASTRGFSNLHYQKEQILQ